MIKIKEAKTTTDANIINKALKYKNKKYKIAIAANPHISKETMLELVNLNDESISSVLASNRNLLPDIAEIILNCNNFYSLEALSKNPACPSHILQKMKDIDVFYLHLAENPSTDFSTLEYIMSAKKESEYCYHILSDILQQRSDIKCVTTFRRIEKK